MSARFGLSSRLIRRAAGSHDLLTCGRPVLVSRVTTIIQRSGRGARGRAHFTTDDGRQRGRFLTVAFTPGGYDKDTIIELTKRSLEKYHDELGDSSAAVVLASKGIADWLEDPNFLSRLLAPWRSSIEKMDILAAVVEGVRVPQYPSDPPPSEGIAIMTGEEVNELLPGLWDTGLAPGTQQYQHPHHHNQHQTKASIEFRLPPLMTDSRRLHATLPLANTLFMNGRPSTMFAATLSEKVKSSSQRHASFTRIVEKTSQVVAPGRGPRYFTSVSAPLIAVTPPRKIIQGLGNILRQLEVRGQPAPASMELEKLVPELLASRSKHEGRIEERPLTVWAAIYPKEVISQRGPWYFEDSIIPSWIGYKVPTPLPPKEFGYKEEEVYSKELRSLMPRLLARGGQIRQVLSGGGGWGQKQGLLSLDAESRYATEDQEDIESFIRSFKGEEPEGSGIVTPGSYVQFLVERATLDTPWGGYPLTPYQEIKQYQNHHETINLGIHDEISKKPTYDTLRVSRDYFGVSTAGGLYLESPAKTIPRSDRPVLTTKIAVPRTELLSFI